MRRSKRLEKVRNRSEDEGTNESTNRLTYVGGSGSDDGDGRQRDADERARHAQRTRHRSRATMRLELVAEQTDVAAGVAPKLTPAQLVREAVDVGTHLASSIELQQERDERDEVEERSTSKGELALTSFA